MNTLYKNLRASLLSLCIAVLAGCVVISQGKLPFTCTHRDRIVSFLKNNYDEKMVSFAPDSRGWVIEKWQGPGGSWTLLETRPDAISCVLATGAEWVKA